MHKELHNTQSKKVMMTYKTTSELLGKLVGIVPLR